MSEVQFNGDLQSRHYFAKHVGFCNWEVWSARLDGSDARREITGRYRHGYATWGRAQHVANRIWNAFNDGVSTEMRRGWTIAASTTPSPAGS